VDEKNYDSDDLGESMLQTSKWVQLTMILTAIHL
jgi:hypothetical protein